jgi:hypothetical protein
MVNCWKNIRLISGKYLPIRSRQPDRDQIVTAQPASHLAGLFILTLARFQIDDATMNRWFYILGCSLFLLGCSRQKPPQADEKFETLTVAWQSEVPSAGITNHCLFIWTVANSKTNVEQLDVNSLDQAGNILGKYGWKLVSTDSAGSVPSWHFERRARDDGKIFTLEVYNPAWNQP